MADTGERNKKLAFIKWLDKRLLKEYGDKPVPAKRPDPLDELVLTVLSQNTNDVNRDRAYKKLRKKYPTWEKVSKAPAKKIEDEIRVGGLAGQKSRRIKNLLLEIKQREGGFDLGRLCEMSRQDGLSYLYSFKGVGEKTAAIVLLFCCGIPVFPVDTHIHRLSKRLGLVPENADAKKTHEIMGGLVPDKIMHRFHINVIEHGRAVCNARKPDCSNCCLIKKCPSADIK